MAFTGGGYFLEVSFLDAGANVTSFRCGLQGANIGAAVTNAATIVAALEPLSDCLITSYNVRQKFINSTTTGNEGAASMKALLTLALTTTGKKASIAIPAPIADLFGTGTFGSAAWDIVQPTTDLDAFLACFQSGQQGTISDGEFVTATPFLSGVRVTRNRRLGG